MSRVEKATWYKWTREEFRTGQTICHVVVVFFFSLYRYLSYIFYFKESTIITTEKQKEKQLQKNTQKCGGQVTSNIVWLCPSRNKVLFFFQLVLNLHQYPLVPFTIIGGNLLVLLHIYLLIFFFFLSFLLAKNKSLSSSSLKWIYNFKHVCFPPKLVANEQLQQCFFGYSWYGPSFRLRISFVRKFLTNLFPFLSFVVVFFLYSLIYH